MNIEKLETILSIVIAVEVAILGLCIVTSIFNMLTSVALIPVDPELLRQIDSQVYV